MKASYDDGAIVLAKVLMSLDETAVERTILVVGVDRYENGQRYFVAHLVGDKALADEAIREMTRRLTLEG